MAVFLSWSGEASREVAAVLHRCLKRALYPVELWMSEQDIRAGADWWAATTSALTESSLVVLCLTPENQGSPWLHFESGYVARTVGVSRLLPYLVGLPKAQLTGPLTQLQAVQADRAGTLELMRAINGAFEQPGLGSDELQLTFEAWWPKIEAGLRQAESGSPHVRAPRSQQALLEEILETVRRLAQATVLGSTSPLTAEPTQSGPTVERLFERWLLPTAFEEARAEWSRLPAEDLAELYKDVAERAELLAGRRAEELGLARAWERWLEQRRERGPGSG